MRNLDSCTSNLALVTGEEPVEWMELDDWGLAGQWKAKGQAIVFLWVCIATSTLFLSGQGPFYVNGYEKQSEGFAVKNKTKNNSPVCNASIV